MQRHAIVVALLQYVEADINRHLGFACPCGPFRLDHQQQIISKSQVRSSLSRLFTSATAAVILSSCSSAMSTSYRAGRALLSLPRAGPSTLSQSAASKSSRSRRGLHIASSRSTSSPAAAVAVSCTCSSLSSRWSASRLSSRRSLVTSARLAYPATAAETASASKTPADKSLPSLTENDKKRLSKLRNVGISAHIDRCASAIFCCWLFLAYEAGGEQG